MTKRFNFATLLGRGGAPRAESETPAEDEDERKEDEREDGAMDEEETDEASAEDRAAEDEDGEDEAAEDDKETAAMSPAEKAAFAKGRKAEKARIGAILTAEGVGPATIALAAHLAVNTSLAPKEAAATIAASPKGGGLAAAMAGRTPRIGQGGGGAATGPSSADLMKARFDRKRG